MDKEKEIIELIKEIKEKRKKQDTFWTSDPIYLVQTRCEDNANIEYDDVDLLRFGFDEIDEPEDNYLSIEDIKDGALKCTPIPYDLATELEQAEEYEIENIYNEYYEYKKRLEVIPLKYKWKTVAYFLLLEDAENYQKYQSHNLGISRIYVDNIGYRNGGKLAKLLKLLDN